MEEVIKKRNLTSKHYDIGNNEYLMDAHIGHIHYKDGRHLEDINTTLEKCVDGWMQTKASYHLVLPRFSNERMVFLDRFSANREIIFTPICNQVEGYLVDSDKGWIQKKVRYDNAFGDGLHLECIAGNISFRKEIIIDKFPSSDIEIKFKVNVNEEIIKVGNRNYALKGNRNFTGKKVGIGEGTEDELSYIKPAMAVDSDMELIPVSLHLEIIDGDLYLIKRISRKSLEDAVFPVRTDDEVTYYPAAGDGYVGGTNASWDTVHDATDGSFLDYTSDTVNVCRSNTTVVINRGFYPFDSSGIGAGATVSATTFSLYFTSNTDGGHALSYYGIVQADQPSTSELTNADFNNCGATDNPTTASVIDMTSISTSAYNDFAFGGGQLSWVIVDGWTMLGIRIGHDIEDTAADAENQGAVRNSEYSGTDSDPKLAITYTPAAPSTIATQGWGNLADKYLSGNLM